MIAESGMLVIPWQLAATAIIGTVIVVVSLVMQLRDKADRDTQRLNQAINAFQKVYFKAQDWARKDYEQSTANRDGSSDDAGK